MSVSDILLIDFSSSYKNVKNSLEFYKYIMWTLDILKIYMQSIQFQMYDTCNLKESLFPNTMIIICSLTYI